jgi:DNA ligase 1
MQSFTNLYLALDDTNRTNEKVDILTRYFTGIPPEDGAWALYFLTGRRIGREISATSLRSWAAEEAQLPLWLVEESYDAVGDLAETLALLLPPVAIGASLPLHRMAVERIAPLAALPLDQQRSIIVDTWRQLTPPQKLVWQKLIMGSFRVGVGKTLVIRALAQVAGIEQAAMAHRVMGHWQPTAQDYQLLLAHQNDQIRHSQPYPFYLAYPITEDISTLGDIGHWQVEWKWDGIRAQVIRRSGETLVWTRGEELVTDIYPEISAIGQSVPDGTVLAGEIVAWEAKRPLPFNLLQKRIGRKKVDAKLLQSAPVALIVYDQLEENGIDIRNWPLVRRREQLAALCAPLLADHALQLSPLVYARSWEELTVMHATARSRAAEGFMLKRADSPYGVGHVRGDWWKWKIDPYSVDAVLIYAQRGHGRRASLYTDYTFALWENGELVPIAKAYSGLTDAEIREVDAYVRRQTMDRFGPVRAVKPELVFEIAFDGLQASSRHKSGIALRFPRMARWRKDKRPEDADTLATLQLLLTTTGTK